jgi:hypothetical protein
LYAGKTVELTDEKVMQLRTKISEVLKAGRTEWCFAWGASPRAVHEVDMPPVPQLDTVVEDVVNTIGGKGGDSNEQTVLKSRRDFTQVICLFLTEGGLQCQKKSFLKLAPYR